MIITVIIVVSEKYIIITNDIQITYNNLFWLQHKINISIKIQLILILILTT